MIFSLYSICPIPKNKKRQVKRCDCCVPVRCWQWCAAGVNEPHLMFRSMNTNSVGTLGSRCVRSSCMYSTGGSITSNCGESRSVRPSSCRARRLARRREAAGRVGMLALTCRRTLLLRIGRLRQMHMHFTVLPRDIYYSMWDRPQRIMLPIMLP